MKERKVPAFKLNNNQLLELQNNPVWIRPDFKWMKKSGEKMLVRANLIHKQTNRR